MPSIRWKPSVTVAAVIHQLMDGQDHFLLVQEETPEGLKLNNPAGHLDPGESLTQAVVREVLEETARGFTPDAVVGIYLSRFQRPATSEDVTYLRIAFTGSVTGPAPGWVLDEGIVANLWLTAEQIRARADEHRSPLLMRSIDDWIAGRRYPLELLTTDTSVFAPEIKSPAA